LTILYSSVLWFNPAASNYAPDSWSFTPPPRWDGEENQQKVKLKG